MTVGCQSLFRATTGAARATFHIPGYSQAISHHCPHPAEEKQAQRGEDTYPEPHRESARLKLTSQDSWPRAWPVAFLLALNFKRTPNPTRACCCPLTTPIISSPKGWENKQLPALSPLFPILPSGLSTAGRDLHRSVCPDLAKILFLSFPKQDFTEPPFFF